MVEEALLNYLFILLFSLGITLAFGLLTYICNLLFYRLIGTQSHAVCVATGLIGTPVHEFAHAFFCIVFNHRINEICFYQFNAEDGTLGYVQFAYRRANLYERIGDFFIGIAPIIFGTGILMGLIALGTGDQVFNTIGKFIDAGIDFRTEKFWNRLFETLGKCLQILFNEKNLSNFWWWLSIVLALNISLHMNMSPADFRVCLSGLIFCVGGLFVVCLVLFLVDLIFQTVALASVTSFFVTCGTAMITVFSVALLFSLALIVLAFLIWGLRWILTGKKA